MQNGENCPSGVYRARRYLLTKNEAAFFRVLSELVDRRYLVSCKVRLADIITCNDQDWRMGAANRIAQKHVDFVISRADSSRIVAGIELDDRSHQRPERRQRDRFVNRLFDEMEVRLIRIPAQWRYDRRTVAAVLSRAGLTVEGRGGPAYFPTENQARTRVVRPRRNVPRTWMRRGPESRRMRSHCSRPW